MPTKIPVFETEDQIPLEFTLPGVSADGTIGAVWGRIPMTKQLLNIATTDATVAQFIVREIFTLYALKLKEIGGKPV